MPRINRMLEGNTSEITARVGPSREEYLEIEARFSRRRNKYQFASVLLASAGIATGLVTSFNIKSVANPYSNEPAVVEYNAVTCQKDSLSNYSDSLPENIMQSTYIKSELERLVEKQEQLRASHPSIGKCLEASQANREAGDKRLYILLGSLVGSLALGALGFGLSDFIAEKQRMNDWDRFHGRK